MSRGPVAWAPDPDFFAHRELAITRAITVNRDQWTAPERVSLFDSPTVELPPAELRVVRQAHARASALGLVLPPYPKTTVRFVRGPQGTAIGAQTRERDGVIEMAFVTGQALEGLRRLALHELKHVDQFARDLRLAPDEAEEDAEMFAWNAMLGWNV